MNVRMLHWLEKRAMLTPERIAIHGDGQSISYAQLRMKSVLAAKRLASYGAGPKAHIALLCSNGAHVPLLIHAIHYLGAVVVPLNIRLTAHELAYQLRDANCSMLIYDDELSALADAAARRVPDISSYDTSVVITSAGEDEHDLHQLMNKAHDTGLSNGFELSDTSNINTYIRSHDIHSIIYTSGTTGRPKGVVLTFANYWASAVDSAMNLGLSDDDHWLACLPLFHVGGMSILVRSVIYGIPVTIHKQFDPYVVNHAIYHSRITMISVVSAMLTRMIEITEEQGAHKVWLQRKQTGLYPEHLRCVLLGGGPAPLPLLKSCQEYMIPVFQTYGLTETASQFATLSPDHALKKIGSAGKPLFQSELKIVADGKTAPIGETGEIHVRGPSVTAGYWMDPIIPAHDEEGWLATGDLGYVDEEGFLYVLDRRNDLIISGGENIYPAEIESVLLSHPTVAEAGVTGIDDHNWGQVPVAFIVIKDGHVFSEQMLLAHCADHLAKYKLPTRIFSTTTLPRNAAGKLLRRQLRDKLTE